MYWAEIYEPPPSPTLMNADTKIEETIQKFEDQIEEISLQDDEEKKDLTFKKFDVGNLKGKKLPNAVQFKGIYTANIGKTVQEGTHAIEFTPGGFTEKTVVYVTNTRDQIYSIVLSPIGGRSKIERGEISPNEV